MYLPWNPNVRSTPLSRSVGQVISSWDAECSPTPGFWFITLVGALTEMLFTFLPIDWKHEYKYGTGESWVCTAKRQMTPGGSTPPFAQSPHGGAFFKTAELADKAAWKFYVASAFLDLYSNWHSMMHSNSGCKEPGLAGNAVAPPWAFVGDDTDWQRNLWTFILDNPGWTGPAGINVPPGYGIATGAWLHIEPLTTGAQCSHRMLYTPNGFVKDPAPRTIWFDPKVNADDYADGYETPNFSLGPALPKDWFDAGFNCQYQTMNSGTGIGLATNGEWFFQGYTLGRG